MHTKRCMDRTQQQTAAPAAALDERCRAVSKAKRASLFQATGEPVVQDVRTSSSSSSSDTLSKRPSEPSTQMSPGMTCA